MTAVGTFANVPIERGRQGARPARVGSERKVQPVTEHEEPHERSDGCHKDREIHPGTSIGGFSRWTVTGSRSATDQRWGSGGLSHKRCRDGIRRDLVLRVAAGALAANSRTRVASAARVRLRGGGLAVECDVCGLRLRMSASDEGERGEAREHWELHVGGAYPVPFFPPAGNR
jgi:hypothetical protein